MNDPTDPQDQHRIEWVPWTPTGGGKTGLSTEAFLAMMGARNSAPFRPYLVDLKKVTAGQHIASGDDRQYAEKLGRSIGGPLLLLAVSIAIVVADLVIGPVAEALGFSPWQRITVSAIAGAVVVIPTALFAVPAAERATARWYLWYLRRNR